VIFMPKTERLIPLAAMEKIIKKSGAERVSDNAKTALKAVLEEYASRVSADAVRFALHAGRKTIKAGDIQLAVKK
jgi:histone H3/H4